MDEEEYDNALESFLHSDANTLYVKANQVDVRVHLIGLFTSLIETLGADACIDEFRKLEKYVKQG